MSTPRSPEASSAGPSALPELSATPRAPASVVPVDGAAAIVLDAARATLASRTVRVEVDYASPDPADDIPPIKGRGQVSFTEPRQMRFESDPVGDVVPGGEIIIDGTRVLVSGREASYLPPDSWLVIDAPRIDDPMVWNLFVRQYGDYTLVLVPALGVLTAAPAGAEEVRGEPATKYVAQVDVTAARPYVPEHLLATYDTQMDGFAAVGTAVMHELEVWVDGDGRIVRTRYVQDTGGSTVEALVVTYEFSDFGAPMDLDPPDGAEVLTIDEARERYVLPGLSPDPPT